MTEKELKELEKVARENAYLTKRNLYAIRINHFFLFLI